MIRIGVQSDIAKLRNALTAFDDTQMPFTVAKALTMTAQDAQLAVRAAIPSEFTLRRDWIVKGIRTIAARKDNLTAMVYSIDPFMGRQEHGGEKIPMDGGRNLAIPLSGARPSDADIIPTALLPSNLGRAEYTISKKSGKQVTMKGTGGAAFRLISNGKTYLMLRAGGVLKVMYLITPSAYVPPRLNLGTITMETVRRRFAANFFTAAKQAMATRRTGGTLSEKP
jgi:hypothetical protein